MLPGIGKGAYRQGKDAGTTEPKKRFGPRATLNNFGTLFFNVALGTGQYLYTVYVSIYFHHHLHVYIKNYLTIYHLFEEEWVVSLTYISKAVEARYDIRQISAVCAILELVFIRSDCLEFSDTSNGTCISACEIDAFIQFLCTS